MKRRIALACLVVFSLLFVSTQVQAQFVKRDVSKLQVGMTTDQVRNEIGRPNHINKYGTSKGEEQQWVYQEGRYQSLYIYFENGLYTGYYQRMGEKGRNIP